MSSRDEHMDAARVASQAGRALLDVRKGSDPGLDARALGAEGDLRSNHLILDLLQAAYPDDPILSEEGKDDQARLTSARVWIVDPLDGTREFGERDRLDWAVHVALAVDGAPVVGAVAMPAVGITAHTGKPPQVPPRTRDRIRIVVSRSRPPEFAREVASRLDADLAQLGSAGAKTMAVVVGAADVYIHAGGQYEWDSAAPVAVALASGLHASRLDGSPLRYNQPNPWLPDQLVCRPELAGPVLEALQGLYP